MLNNSNNEELETLIFSTGEKVDKSLKSENPKFTQSGKNNKKI